jgi:PAS domain S-box-containing protein/putative nucleotidyltransferase with HDIG domain
VGYAEHDPEKSVRLAAHAGNGAHYLENLKVSWGDVPLGMGPTGTAIREARTVVAHDLKTQSHYSPWRDNAILSGFAGSIAIPLKVRGEVLGALTIYTDDPLAFDESEVALLEELSDDLAYGIDSRRTRQVQESLEGRVISSETRLRMIIENAPAGIFATRHGTFIYANPRMEEILGYGKGELIGKHSKEVVVPEDWPLVLAAMRELVAHGFTGNFAVRAMRKDHSMIGLGLQDVQSDYEGVPALIGMAQDITERQRAQAEILHYTSLLEHAAEATLQAVAAMVEQRDPYTAGHERRVGALAAAIGQEMGWSEHAVQGLRLCGMVHDIGKIAVPAEILSKPTRLNDIEMALVRMHAQTGFEVLKNVDFPWPVAEVIYQHHERLDGTGYPRRLQGDAILPEARIMMVADVVESMSSHRPYRPSLGLEAALEEIERHSGTWYDAQVVATCLRLFRDKGYTLPN